MWEGGRENCADNIYNQLELHLWLLLTFLMPVCNKGSSLHLEDEHTTPPPALSPQTRNKMPNLKKKICILL